MDAKSHINGTGHGDAHSWECVGSQRGCSQYRCRVCPAVFYHYYDEIPNIFKAMEAANIILVCVPKAAPVAETAGAQ